MKEGNIRAGIYTKAQPLKLDRKLLITSRRVGYFQIFGNVMVLVFLFLWASQLQSVWQGVLAYIGIGFAIHRIFFPLHDCLHYSLLPTKGENRFFGVILAALLGTSFDAIRNQHMEHHKKFGTLQDSGATDYYCKFQTRWELLVFLLGPLTGSLFINNIGDYVMRIFRGKKSQKRNMTLRQSIEPSTKMVPNWCAADGSTGGLCITNPRI